MRRKKLLTLVGSIFLVLVLATLSLMAACAAPAPTPTPTPTPKPTPTPTPTPAPPPAEKVFTWREVTTCPAGTDCYKLLKSFADAMTAASGGRLVVEHYGPGEIVTELDFMEATSQRVVEITSGDYSKGGEFPVGAPYASMPMGVDLMEWIILDLDKGGKEFLNSKIYEPFGIKYLGGIAQMGCCLNTTKEIKSLADCKDLIIRDFGLKGELCAKMGIVVTYVPFPECYLALTTGTIEGTDMLHDMIIDMSFYEPAKYVILPDIVPYLGAGAWLNLEAYNELPDDLKVIVDETFEAFSFRFARDQIYKAPSMLAKFVELGGTINYFSDADVAKIKALAVEVWEDAAAKDPISAEFIALYKDYMVELGYEIPA